MRIDLKGTPVLKFLCEAYVKYKDEADKIVFVLEGSSGSSKTYSIMQFLSYYASINKKKKIIAGRGQMTWTIATIWQDWKDYIAASGFDYEINKTQKITTLWENSVRFIGADDPQKLHGARQDVAWFNEIIELNKAAYDQVDQRTNELMILDFNPSVSEHWIFDTLLTNMQKVSGERYLFKKIEIDGEIMIVLHMKSTFLDNVFLNAGQRIKILSYDPSNPENVLNGTADEYLWKVYGLGERSDRKGKIFRVNWLDIEKDKIPSGLPWIWCIDWGFTNDPTAIVKLYKDVNKRQVYLDVRLYEPCDNVADMVEIFNKIGIKTTDIVVADSADKYNDMSMNNGLRENNFNVIKAFKTGLLASIGELKKNKILAYPSQALKMEADNYIWQYDDKQDKYLNAPIDKHNHIWDATRYGNRAIDMGYFN